NGDSKMNVNDVQTLTITYEPENATNVNFTYLSSDSEVLTVDENGKVEALKEGSATITVSNKEISETFTITVSPVKKGCGSSNAMMLLPLLGVALFIIRKRRFI
ncbi:MAG: Ig-like domain-containing protein, partial [Bacilli bacterium]